MSRNDSRRQLPSVDHVLQDPSVQALATRHGRPLVLRALRALLDEARAGAPANASAFASLGPDLAAVLEARVVEAGRFSLRRVINATGVVVHTNLGRAPLSREAAARVAEIATGASNLEYDLTAGERGDREVHAEARLRGLLEAEASIVVNNCAAAVLLAVNSFAEGRDAIVSRGELVEIGGSFRIPEILRKGGARLVEVGTTNRTRLADYRAALRPETGMLLKVHRSNFDLVGFTEEATREELAALCREAQVPLVEDLGSGLLQAPSALFRDEPSVARCLEGGADVVTFSGDKLLGGPQAGIAAGRRELIARMRRNPLYRALRVDKMTLAALDATLAEHASGRAHERVPVLRMLAAEATELQARAEHLARALAETGVQASVVEGHSAVGGGAAPALELPTRLVAVTHAKLSPDALAAELRRNDPPVIVRIADGRVVLDPRTIAPEEEADLVAAFRRVLS